ncbi:inner kinetochore subunit Mif2p [Monosporozyma servazzii]
MDYMSLGSKSRKTGFKLSKNVSKDEYSMENMDDYFDDEENRDNNNSNFNFKRSGMPFKQVPELRGFDPNRSGLSIKSPSQMNMLPQTEGSVFTPISSTPTLKSSTAMLSFNEPLSNDQIPTASDSVPQPQRAYKSDFSNFYTNYDIPETIVEEDDVDELSSNERKIRRSLPDLMEESEIELSATDESSLLNTSQDALLESEMDAKYLQTNNVDSTVDTDYTPSEHTQFYNDAAETSKAPLRRSNRIKIPTLDYWRNEKIVYKKRSESPGLDIAKVITYAEDEDIKQKSKIDIKRKLSTRGQEQRKKMRFDNPETTDTNVSYNANSDILHRISKGKLKDANWINDGILEGTVQGKTPLTKKLKTTKEVIAIAPNFINNEREYHSPGDNYKISILFNSQRDHFANGYLTLPVNGRKSKSNIDNLYITFHVLKGIVEVIVSDNNKFICTEGATFQVPSHNSYSLINKGKDEVKLYFVQVTIKK